MAHTGFTEAPGPARKRGVGGDNRDSYTGWRGLSLLVMPPWSLYFVLVYGWIGSALFSVRNVNANITAMRKVKYVAEVGFILDPKLPLLYLLRFSVLTFLLFRDNCQCHECLHPVTKQRLVNVFKVSISWIS